MGRPAALAFAVLAAFAAPALAGDQTYVNARFGTVLTFPDDIFSRPQPPSENGDGLSWESDDGGWLGVWGQYNALEQDEKALLKFLSDTFETVTYSRTGKGFVVLSGYDGGKVFYQRTIFGADDTLHTMLMRYPKALKAKYDPLVGPVAASLRGP